MRFGKLPFLPSGESLCTDGQALVPETILMSSRKKNRLGPDKCNDGDLDTVCTTKSEPYPTVTLDFGQAVQIAEVNLLTMSTCTREQPFRNLLIFVFNKKDMVILKVHISPNKKFPGLSEARIVITNETVPAGTRVEGHLIILFVSFSF